MKTILSILLLMIPTTAYSQDIEFVKGRCGEITYKMPKPYEGWEVVCKDDSYLVVEKIPGYWGACAIHKKEFTGLCDYRNNKGERVISSNCERTGAAGSKCSVLFCREESPDYEGTYLWNVNNKTGEINSLDCPY